MATRPNGGIVGKSIIPGTGQLFGVYSATTAAELTSAGLYSVSTGNIATKVLAVEDPVITDIVYTDASFANIAGAISTAANVTGNVRIIGRNFQSGSTVYIAGQQSAYSYTVSSTEVRARVPSLPLGGYSLMVAGSASTILSNIQIQTANYPVFTTATTFSFVANTAFSTAISAIGATSYAITSGSLPGNVTLNTSTGALSGNVIVTPFPYAATWNFDVTATNALGFTAVQNHYLVFSANTTVDYIILGGGGAGGAPFFGAGGGAGGLVNTSGQALTTADTVTVVIGSGGTYNGASLQKSPGTPTLIFGNISQFTANAFGGGGGGTGPGPSLIVTGDPGGTGGGSTATGGGYPAGGLGSQGGNGGTGSPGFFNGGGGGGGGTGSPAAAGGGGGSGSTYTGFFQTPQTLQGGGSGGPGTGGVPAGGGAVGSPGTNGTGGGGGSGGSGGSGVVYIKYRSPYQWGGGGTITSWANPAPAGGGRNWIHSFTSSSTLTYDYPTWQANANVALTANYYAATVSAPLRAYNAASYTVSAGNTLPGGLSINAAGYITGTASSESTSFYVNAISSTSLISNKEFSFAYSYPVPTWVTAAALPAGNTAVAYSQQLSATVNNLGSVVYSVSAGNTIPDGLTLTSGGLLSGSFTTTSNVSYSFYVRAEHNIGSNYYRERQFTMNVTYVYPVTLLVVAGGGGGGGYHPTSPSSGLGLRGGGGAGGYREFGNLFVRDVKYTITVGSGGTSAPIGSGGQGGPSSVIGGILGSTGYNSLTSTGGGGGGSIGTPTVNGTNGTPGGSGGGHGASVVPGALGGTGQTPVGQPSPLAPVENQGYPGQQASGTTSGQAGGGGGAAGFGQPGQPPTGTSQVGIAGTYFGPFGTGSGGGGGRGRYSTITGANIVYAAGANAVSSGQFIGATNTGNGGSGVTPAAGGSGVVILSVPTGSYTANFSPAPVVTVTNNGPQTVMTFTGSGTYTS